MPIEVVQHSIETLSFGRPAEKDIWTGEDVAFGRVTLAADGIVPAACAVQRRGSVTATSDLRLPDCPDDEAAHRAVFDALEMGRFPDDIDGEFAIGVWDAGARELTLARDRVGIRPLFFARPAAGCIIFASFPDALVDCGAVEGRYRLDQTALIAVGGGQQVGPDTWIEGVWRVPPGHVMWFRPHSERMRRYWRYPVRRASRAHYDHGATARALRRELERAVARTLPERGPIFTHLSGGLDSAALTMLALRLGKCPPEEVIACCFTVPRSCRDVGAIDDEPAARPIAERAGIRFLPFEMDVVSDALMKPLGRTFVTADNPDHEFNRLITAAAAGGAERLLCGFGGDEAVSFNARGAALADFLALRWRALRRVSREMSYPVWRAVLGQAADALLPPPVAWRLRQAVEGMPSHPLHRDQLVSPPFRPKRLRPSLVIEPVSIQRMRLEAAAFVERLEFQNWKAARHGLRYVFPWLDWRLLEFVSTVPPRMQLHEGKRRALFRTAMSDLLPPEFLERLKKLHPAPTVTYQLALNRAALIEEARRVGKSERASAVFDLPEIERRLESLPDADSVAEEIRSKAAKGIQYRDLEALTIVMPFFVARALAQNEADCATRERPSHAAA